MRFIKIESLLSLLILVFALTACGQSGALYLPADTNTVSKATSS